MPLTISIVPIPTYTLGSRNQSSTYPWGKMKVKSKREEITRREERREGETRREENDDVDHRVNDMERR